VLNQFFDGKGAFAGQGCRFWNSEKEFRKKVLQLQQSRDFPAKLTYHRHCLSFCQTCESKRLLSFQSRLNKQLNSFVSLASKKPASLGSKGVVMSFKVYIDGSLTQIVFAAVPRANGKWHRFFADQTYLLYCSDGLPAGLLEGRVLTLDRRPFVKPYREPYHPLHIATRGRVKAFNQDKMTYHLLMQCDYVHEVGKVTMQPVRYESLSGMDVVRVTGVDESFQTIDVCADPPAAAVAPPAPIGVNGDFLDALEGDARLKNPYALAQPVRPIGPGITEVLAVGGECEDPLAQSLAEVMDEGDAVEFMKLFKEGQKLMKEDQELEETTQTEEDQDLFEALHGTGGVPPASDKPITETKKQWVTELRDKFGYEMDGVNGQYLKRKGGKRVGRVDFFGYACKVQCDSDGHKLDGNSCGLFFNFRIPAELKYAYVPLTVLLLPI